MFVGLAARPLYSAALKFEGEKTKYENTNTNRRKAGKQAHNNLYAAHTHSKLPDGVHSSSTADYVGASPIEKCQCGAREAYQRRRGA
jgi:hypothetical protein